MNVENMGFATKAVHAGQKPDPVTGALVAPMNLTSTFVFDEDRIQRWINNDKEGLYFYSRMGNPTQDSLQEKLAAMEGGEAALVTSSGMAAISVALMGLMCAGDHMISMGAVYGGTYGLFNRTFKRINYEVSFLESFTIEVLEEAYKPNTKVVYFESIHNPCLNIIDIEAVCKWAKEKGLKIVVDNTFTPVPLFCPFDYGADVVVHSTTKYLNGHGDHLGGVIIGSKEDIALMRDVIFVDLGPVPSPLQCWLGLRGAKTLAMRLDVHSRNAQKVAEFLEDHPMVDKVIFPGLPSHPDHELAKKYFTNGFGGMVSFVVKDGTQENALTMLTHLQLAQYAVSLGDLDTLVQHPATMTHAKVAKEEREKLGISDGLIRISVGCENVNDILSDLDQALRSIK